MNEHGEKAMEDLKAQGDETVQDLTTFYTDLALNVVCGE